MEKIIAYIIVAFAAFCVAWAFIKQLRSGDDSGKGGCVGGCGGCPSSKKEKSADCHEKKL